jgi:hypothetical protein
VAGWTAARGWPFAAAEPRITAAVFGLAGHETLAEAAARVTVPIEFLLQWDDEFVPRDSGLALFGAFASGEKTLHANPGRHADAPAFELESSMRFFTRHLVERSASAFARPVSLSVHGLLPPQRLAGDGGPGLDHCSPVGEILADDQRWERDDLRDGHGPLCVVLHRDPRSASGLPGRRSLGKHRCWRWAATRSAPRQPARPGAGYCGGAVTIGLAVDESIQRVVTTLEERGVVFRGPVVDQGQLKLAFFTDPDGNELYLAEPKRH